AINNDATTKLTDARTRSNAGWLSDTKVAWRSFSFSKLMLYRRDTLRGINAESRLPSRKEDFTTLRDTAFGLNLSSSSSLWRLRLTSVSVTLRALEFNQIVAAINKPASASI